jgi:hypothetical protein
MVMIKPISAQMVELLPMVRALTLEDKIQLLQFLVEELTDEETLASRRKDVAAGAEPLFIDNANYRKALFILGAWNLTFTQEEIDEMRANPHSILEVLRELEEEDKPK